MDLRGDVIGMNTAIFSRSGGYNGIGFAIPANLVRHIAADLMSDGTVDRGWLGVYIQNLNEGLARSFGFEGTAGVLVSSVVEDGPAAKAGLQDGDIITAIDGEAVTDMADLRMRVALTEPGAELAFDITRDGRKVTRRVTIGELEAQAAAGTSTAAPERDLGMSLETLSPEIAQRLDTETTGVLVANVEQFSPAWDAGLRRGDIIVKVSGQRVHDLGDYRREIAKHDLSEGARLTVESQGAQRFVWLQERLTRVFPCVNKARDLRPGPLSCACDRRVTLDRPMQWYSRRTTERAGHDAIDHSRVCGCDGHRRRLRRAGR